MAGGSSKRRAVVGSATMRRIGRSASSARGALAVAPAVALAIALTLVGSSAIADDASSAKARARDAYDRGAAAHERGDHATAARELALADAIVPSSVTLEAALESAIAADDAVLGMDLCDRSERAKVSPTLAALVRRARARFEQRVGRVRIECARGAPCAATIDGARVDPDRSIVVLAGKHVVRVEQGGKGEERAIDVGPGGSVAVAIEAASPAPRREDARGPSIGWFVAALGATAVAGGVTIGFGVDTASRHGRFVSAGCSGPVHGDCDALASAGRAAQIRTNAMIGVTAALGAASVIVGVVTLRAHGAERAALIVGGDHVAAVRVPWP